MARPIRTARDLASAARWRALHDIAAKVWASRKAGGAAQMKFHAEAKAAVRPGLRDAIAAARRARNALRDDRLGLYEREIAKAREGLIDARADFLALVAGRSRNAKSAAASSLRKLEEGDPDRIRKKYAAKVAAGEKYGAIKALAREFGVSENTIRTVIDKKIAK